MKKLIKPILFVTLAAFITTSALAAEGGNPRKGKHLFKKSCKSCHSSGGGAATKPYVPCMRNRFVWTTSPFRCGDVGQGLIPGLGCSARSTRWTRNGALNETGALRISTSPVDPVCSFKPSRQATEFVLASIV